HDSEQDVGALSGDALRYFHELIEAAHRFQTTGDVGDDARIVRHGIAGNHARHLTRPVQLRIDAVKVHLDLWPETLGERLTLPLRRRITRITIDQARQHDGI